MVLGQPWNIEPCEWIGFTTKRCGEERKKLEQRSKNHRGCGIPSSSFWTPPRNHGFVGDAREFSHIFTTIAVAGVYSYGLSTMCNNLIQISTNDHPYAPCMEYLPTFTPQIAQMWVNIPYMEHLGHSYELYWSRDCKIYFRWSLSLTWRVRILIVKNMPHPLSKSKYVYIYIP